MAFLLDVVRDGILLSHDFGKNNSNIYDESLKIDTNIVGEVVTNYLKQTSKIKRVELDNFSSSVNNNVYGLVSVKNSTATIAVNSNLNVCWNRFTICKELFQLYIDVKHEEHSYKSDDIINQIRYLVDLQEKVFKGFSGTLLIQDKDVPEFQAIIMAIDIIIPQPLKHNFVPALIKSKEDGAIKSYDIANFFKMPEFMIDVYLETIHSISVEILDGTKRIE